jgi:opacity protein-like surface antigen
LDHDGSDVEYGLRLGAQNDEWRTLLTVNYFDSSDDDQEYVKGLVSFDYLLMKESAFKPFIGVNFGYISYTTSVPNGDDDDSGFLYGAQAGFLYRVAEHVQMDISYRYSLSEADRVNHTEGVVFGINYIF